MAFDAARSSPAFDEKVRRLAQYRPFDHDGARLQGAIRGLIFGAAVIDSARFDSLASCQEALRVLWTLDFEIEEIRAVVDAMVEDGLCERIGGGFCLTDELIEQVKAAAAQAEEVETNALAEWELSVRVTAPDLTEKDFVCLREDLALWIARIVSRHGVESALLLYPEQDRAQQLMAEVESIGLQFLPTREARVASIRARVLREFVRNPTQNQRIYLAHRLTAAFELTVLTLDPEASHLVERQFTGHRVYMDTNFLYAILGFSPPAESLAAHRLLTLTKQLGFVLAVTPWTVNELRTSLRKSRSHLDGIRLPSRDYADLMVRAASEKGFDRAFWIAYRDSNLSRQDFFDRASHFDKDLEKLGIEVVDSGCDRVDKRYDDINAYVALLDQVRGLYSRETIVLEHDVKHRLLVEQLRGAGEVGFSNGRYWFLTQDTRLPHFARLVPEGNNADAPELPFCMSSSSWAQVVRAFTPRTDDWEKMVVDLLSSPYVGWKRGLDSAAVLEVVGRIDQYAGDGADLAWEVLADTAKMAQISELKTAHAEREQVQKLVDAAFIAEAEAAKQRAELAVTREQKAAQLQKEAMAAVVEERTRSDQLQADRDTERDRRQGVESDFARAETERAKETQALSARVQQVRAEGEAAVAKERTEREALAEILRRTADRSARRRRVLAATLGVVAVAAAVVLFIASVPKTPLAKIAVILGVVLFVAACVNVATSDKIANRVFTYAGLVLGVAGLAVTLFFQSPQ